MKKEHKEEMEKLLDRQGELNQIIAGLGDEARAVIAERDRNNVRLGKLFLLEQAEANRELRVIAERVRRGELVPARRCVS